MTLRLRTFGILLVFVVVLAACGGAPTNTPLPPTATLRGAIVPTRIPTNTPTATNTPTDTPTITPSPTATDTPTVTPSPSHTPSPTPTNTPSPTPTDTPSITPSPTHTPSPTPTNTPTDTPTVTPSPSNTPEDSLATITELVGNADSFFWLENYELALDYYNQALDIDPDYVNALNGRGLVYIAQGDFASALPQFERVIELNPNYTDAYFNRGLSNSQLGNHEIAIEDFNYFLERNPDDAETYTYRAMSFSELGEIDLSIADLTRAIELDSGYVYAYGARGIVYYSLDDYENAANDLREYVRLAGADATQEMIDLLADVESHLVTTSPTAVVETPVAGLLAYRNTVTGTIDNDTPTIEYTFVAQAGDVIGIQMQLTSGSLDSLVVLRDANGNELGRNDDDELVPGRDSYLRDFTIPANGIYIIVATRYREEAGTSEGEFSLRLEKVGEGTPLPTPEPTEAAGNTLAYGDTVTGRIDNDTPSVEYTFTAQAGDVIGIQLQRTSDSDSLDSLIILLDAGGNEVGRNDDDTLESGLDSYLRDFTIPANGVYTIVATRFREETGTTEGDFSLRLERAGEDSPLPTEAAGNTLSYDDTVTGRIDNDTPSVEYTFTAQAGDVIGIQMQQTSGSLDPLIVLRDANGNELGRNDDDALLSGRDSYLRDFTIPASGVYTIVATRYREEAGTSEGEFSLRLERAGEGSPLPTEAAGNTLVYGDSVIGMIDADTYRIEYTFTASAGDMIGIQMQQTSGALDTLVILLNAGGDELGRNDDDTLAAGRDSYLRDFTIPADGVYTIVATRFREESGTSEGEFILQLGLVNAGANQ